MLLSSCDIAVWGKSSYFGFSEKVHGFLRNGWTKFEFSCYVVYTPTIKTVCEMVEKYFCFVFMRNENEVLILFSDF